MNDIHIAQKAGYDMIRASSLLFLILKVIKTYATGQLWEILASAAKDRNVQDTLVSNIQQQPKANHNSIINFISIQ